MTLSESTPTARTALIIGALGLGVTLLGSLITFQASYLSTKHARQVACIARLDAQEGVIRSKAEELLSAIARFTAGTTSPSQDSFHADGAVVMEKSMQFLAYAPSELYEGAAKIMGTIYLGLAAQSPEEMEAAIKQASTSMTGWTKDYLAVMDKFESRRTACQ